MSERGGPAKPAACEWNGGSAWESNPAPPQCGERPVLKTGRATGPRSLPRRLYSPTVRRAKDWASIWASISFGQTTGSDGESRFLEGDREAEAPPPP